MPDDIWFYMRGPEVSWDEVKEGTLPWNRRKAASAPRTQAAPRQRQFEVPLGRSGRRRSSAGEWRHSTVSEGFGPA